MNIKHYLKFAGALLISGIPFFLYCQSPASKNTNSASLKWAVKNPFEHKVFIENKGQYDHAATSPDKILYYATLGDAEVYFTAHGVYYKITETAKDNSDKKDEQPEEWEYVAPVVHAISMQWQGAANTSSVEGTDEASDYFTYSGPKGTTIKANGFKKIIYKNIYPLIDIMYTLPDKGGIEYSIILHPGADASKIKMDYSDKNTLQIEKDGSISHSVTSAGITDIKEYAPEAHYAKEPLKDISSSFVKQGDMVTFKLGQHDNTSEIIIDPWIVRPSFTVSDDVFDIGKDLAGYIYAQGGGRNYAGGSWQVEKYTSTGTLLWTYTTPWSAWKGGFACDGTGCTYVADGCCTGQVVKLTPSGAIRWTVTNGFTEYWMMAFDCSLTKLYFGIGLHTGSIALCDTANGVLSSTTIVTNTAEVRAMGWAPNSNIYFLTETTDDFIGVNSAFSNLFTVPSGYNWGYDPNPQYVTGNNPVTGHNAIGAGLTFVATSDGGILDKRNLSTGALITSTPIPGGSAEWYSGITVDYCGNIFVGTRDSVVQFDSNLHWANGLHVPDSVYAVIQGNNSDILAGGMNFLADLDFPTISTSSVTIVSTNAGCSNCNATATATLKLCGVADTTTVSYLWSNGNTTREITGLCAGTYTVTVSGCFQNTYVDSVTIHAGGGLTLTPDSTAATCSIPGSASVTVVGGTVPYTYTWSNGGTNSSISGLGAGIYCVTVKDHNGCADSLCIHVDGSALPTITITPNPDSICSGGQVGLTAAGALTYAWTPPGSGLSCYTCANPSASPTVTTTYTVVGTDVNGCKNKDSVVVKVFLAPVVTVKALPDTVCAGGTIAITATGGGVGATFVWNPASPGLSCYNCSNPISTPTATTTYTVTVTDAQGCSASATVTVYLAEPPTINVQATGTSICEGSSVTLIANATNITGPYTWNPGGTTGPIVTVTPTLTTTYTVSASSACGVASANITIVVNPMPVVNMAADLYVGCVPMCIQFRNTTTISQGAIATYLWNFGNGDTMYARAPVYCYPTSGTYTVTLTATSDSGCSSTLKKSNMITVYSRPNASFTYSPQEISIMEPIIQFTDNSKDIYGIIAWAWNFGDAGTDATSTIKNPTHSYQDTGTFCPSLVVMNQHGCVDTATNCLVINPIFTLYIPSAFSPNGDSKNDVFIAKGNNIKSFEMYIFDRWGMQLFHSTDINQGWNGTVGGGTQIAQEDTYVYMITAYDNKNKEHTYTGNVNLIK